MRATALTFHLAGDEDLSYIYDLCERTMRSYVEADLGDCFERVALPTIQNLLRRGMFSKVCVNDVLVGAIAYERHATYIQLEEIYLEPARQNEGLGTEIMGWLIAQSALLALPIRLHLLASNPARRFYERLGFRMTRSTPEVNFMERPPPIAGTGLSGPHASPSDDGVAREAN